MDCFINTNKKYLWLFENFSAITASANEVSDLRLSFFLDEVEFLRIFGSEQKIEDCRTFIPRPLQVINLPLISVKSLTLDLFILETLESFRSFSGGGVIGVLSVGGVNGVGGSLTSLSDVGLVFPLLIFV